MPDKIELNLFSQNLQPFSLKIISESNDKETLFQIGSQEAAENSEAEIQLLEGCSYEYKLSHNFNFRDLSGIIRPSKLNPSSGRLTPGNYVGTLTLDILDESSSLSIQFQLEVRSNKIHYREDYRYMLEYITKNCTDLLLNHSSPATQTFTIDYYKNSETLYQRFAFVKSIIDSDEFNEAVHRIISNPVKGWENIDEESDIRRIKKLTSYQLRQLVARKDRIILHEENSLRKHFNSVPRVIRITKKIETVDVPENRFIKYVLEIFFQFISEVRHNLDIAGCHYKTYNETLILEGKLGSILKQSIFKGISHPATLPLNSPVLQRREGYREILRVWLIFDLAAKLFWKGGENVYNAGKRDVAILYEYWLFFRLLDMLQEIYSINPKDVNNLMEQTSDGLGLKLKSGQYLPLNGVYTKGGRNLNVEFSYNRTFSGKSDYPNEGSWARSLRPDYTLTLWPADFSQKQAEEEELIVHMHFDSKYKIEKLTEIIGRDDENLNIEKEEQRIGTYKRADLLKMHAYKDAIRRTGGAYVLYPGNDRPVIMKGFHEIIPGLGAFCIRPSKNDDGTTELKSFIIEITKHLINRASQQERITYHTFDILKNKIENKIFEHLPEKYNGTRVAHPAEIFVLIGYCKNEEHFEWIGKNELYNFRMNSGRGSLRLNPEAAGADYILLHSKGSLVSNDIRRIKEKGPRVFSKKNLLELKYPTPHHNNYLVFKIEKLKEEAFKTIKWDISQIKGYKSGRSSGLPFSISLLELMKVKILSF